jgi:TetR/AcrR family transcriptional regulator, transcriptional repressor for nem operon
MTAKSTRDQIIETADKLFYEEGYEHTSFADIAQAVAISRGNFYHHFKAKDEILDAVIGLRLANTRRMLERWEIADDDPAERIRSYIHIVIDNRAKIRRYGCPVGTLCAELAKLDHPSREEANELFMLFRVWLRRQFALMGRKSDADELAMHVLAWSQGVATLANAFRDEKFVTHEVQEISAWLDEVQASSSRQ